MQIQYAIFCESMDFKTLPHSLKQPISILILPDINTLRDISLPLFITFIDGNYGKHTLHVKLISPTREVDIPDFDFDWSKNKLTYGNVFVVSFQFDIYGLYVFRLSVDGQFLREIPIPVIAEKKP